MKGQAAIIGYKGETSLGVPAGDDVVRSGSDLLLLGRLLRLFEVQNFLLRRLDLSLPVLQRISLSRGSCSRISLVSGVRSRITQMASKGRSRSTTAPGSSRWSLNTVISARRRTADQSASRSATSW